MLHALTLRILLFSVTTLFLIFYSLPAFKKKVLYGFTRFIAFESILTLFLVNASFWFIAPLSLKQIISWILLCLSLLLALIGSLQIRIAGKAGNILDETEHLVTGGIYRFIRHPLYVSLICFSLGIFMKNISWLSSILTVGILISLIFTSIYEERETLEKFGEEYARYCNTTHRFIPFLF